jgi:hypothetical protein
MSDEFDKVVAGLEMPAFSDQGEVNDEEPINRLTLLDPVGNVLQVFDATSYQSDAMAIAYAANLPDGQVVPFIFTIEHIAALEAFFDQILDGD